MFVNKGMYIMLCLFLGGLGIHKFYAGKWFQGLLYVAFCWTVFTSWTAFSFTCFKNHSQRT